LTTGSRDITSTTAAAAAASTIIPVIFAKLELDSGDILMHTGLGDITWGGDTYSGVGKLGSIGTAEEVSDLSRSPITLTLSGIPNDLIAIVLGQYYQGRSATISLGYFDLTTRILVDTPTIIYKGNIDTSNIAQDQTGTVTISVESRFSAWDKPNVRRYNNADQQLRFPTDKGLQFVERATDQQIFWGGKQP